MCANGAVLYTTHRCGRRKKEILPIKCGRDRTRSISVNAIAVERDSKKIEQDRAHARTKWFAHGGARVQPRVVAHDARRS